MEFLKENALEFEEIAKEKLKEGSLRMAAFCLEQSFQLLLKYFLVKKVGDFPKTHSLIRLAKEAGKLSKKIERFRKKHLFLLGSIERAYLGARYYPMEFSEKEIKVGLRVLGEFKKIVIE